MLDTSLLTRLSKLHEYQNRMYLCLKVSKIVEMSHELHVWHTEKSDHKVCGRPENYIMTEDFQS